MEEGITGNRKEVHGPAANNELRAAPHSYLESARLEETGQVLAGIHTFM